MKTKTNLGLLVLALFMAIAVAAPQQVHAAGTEARTTISNEALIAYDVNSVTQPTLYSCETSACNNTSSTETTDFMVDRKVNFTVTNISGDPLTAFSNQTAAFLYEVTNTGNDWFAYTLSNGYVDTSSILDNGDAQQMYLDDGDNNFDAGDTLYVDNTTFGDFSSNEPFRVWVTAKIDNDAANGDTADSSLTAVAVEADASHVASDIIGTAIAAGGTAGSGEAFAFADTGNDNSEALASMTWQIGAPVINVQKTGDTTHADSAFSVLVPGAYAEYTITLSYDAAGSGSAGGIIISDDIPANTKGSPNRYGAGEIQRIRTIDGVAQATEQLDSTHADVGNWGGASAEPAAGTTITVNCGTTPAFVLDSTNDQCEIKFAVEIL